MAATTAIALACSTLILFYDIPGSFEFALRRRLALLATLALAAVAGAVATVVFHTITGNRVLTPAIIGLESLLLLVQAGLVFLFGTAGLTYVEGPPRLLAETAVMTAFASALFAGLFHRRHDLRFLLLVGVVLGGMFRSLSIFFQQMLSPNEFDFVLAQQYARLTRSTPDLLPWAGALLLGAVAVVWTRRRRLDVVALGREAATSLGVDYRSESRTMFLLVAMMTAVSTALIGPMTFFGFLVATITYRLCASDKHAHTLPLAVAIALATLTACQFVTTQVAGRGGVSVVVEFVGGVVFLATLFRKGLAA